jgi:predicted RNase H-like HicB family nuclease
MSFTISLPLWEWSLTRLAEGYMKSYVFPVVLERDEDVWRVFIPELEAKGVATWANSKEQALINIREVAQIVIESMLEDGESLPPTVAEIDQLVVAVTV